MVAIKNDATDVQIISCQSSTLVNVIIFRSYNPVNTAPFYPQGAHPGSYMFSITNVIYSYMLKYSYIYVNI